MVDKPKWVDGWRCFSHAHPDGSDCDGKMRLVDVSIKEHIYYREEYHHYLATYVLTKYWLCDKCGAWFEE